MPNTQTGEFTVPAGVPAGTVQIEVIGDHGSRGATTYASQGEVELQQRRVVRNVTYNYDPLAQTFTLQQGRHIAGIDLWFKKNGTSRVVVQIRETLVGMPNRNVIAEATVEPENIATDGTPTRVEFRPIWLDANVEYAIVILTDDAIASVAVCEIGKYDSVRKQYVTQQPYQVGVLLSSSNASTWTPHQTIDLTFRLLACKFTETQFEYNLGNFAANQNTDLLIKTNVERVATDTDVEFVLTNAEGVENVLTEDMPVALKDELNGNVSVKARIKGSGTRSPVLYQGLQLFLGKQRTTADYVTRSISAGTNSTIRIVLSD